MRGDSTSLMFMKEHAVAPQSYAFLGTPGFIRDQGRFDDRQMLSALGGNAGNLLFQYGVSQIVDAPLVHISMSDIPYLDTPEVRATKTLIFPAADHLRPDTDWQSLNNYLAGVNKSLVVLGLGALAPGPQGERAMIDALKASPSVMRMIDIFRERAVLVTVRGEYSRRVCTALGLPGVEVAGCPSALLSPDPGLGDAIAARLSFAASGATPLRMSATAAAPFEIAGNADARALEQRLLAWASKNDGLYIQQSGDMPGYLSCNGRWYDLEPATRDAIGDVIGGQTAPLDMWAFLAKRGRFPTAVPAWLSELRGQDLVMGTRHHGAFAALAVGTPGVIVGRGTTKSELALTHHLPFLDHSDALAARSLPQAAAMVAFNPLTFDRARIIAARALVQGFDRLSIPLAPHVRALARQSRPSAA